MLFKRPRKKYNWLWWPFIMLCPNDVIYMIFLNQKVKAKSNMHFVISLSRKIQISYKLRFNILNLEILFISMIDINIFFEFISMILKNHMFKIDLSSFFRNVSLIFLICQFFF